MLETIISTWSLIWVVIYLARHKHLHPSDRVNGIILSIVFGGLPWLIYLASN